jgi:tRNA threonylcarbamoyladenosine biosynthesis protein TsaE
MTLTLTTTSVEQTRALGTALASLLAPGVVVVAAGGLGAGKTAMAQGLASGLGVTDRVTSPTFTLLATHDAHNERGIRTMLHADLYRAHSGEEVDDLAIGEMVESGAVCFVEWGDRAPDVFGSERVFVTITQGQDQDERTISIANHSTVITDQDLHRVLGTWVR